MSSRLPHGKSTANKDGKLPWKIGKLRPGIGHLYLRSTPMPQYHKLQNFNIRPFSAEYHIERAHGPAKTLLTIVPGTDQGLYERIELSHLCDARAMTIRGWVRTTSSSPCAQFRSMGVFFVAHNQKRCTPLRVRHYVVWKVAACYGRHLLNRLLSHKRTT